ncbi:MAG: hypothetical protein R6X34_25075 [Chloroflexota bacterium]
MKKTPFVWLGANRARKWPVGAKARLLDKAASAGLPVPMGAILMDELFQLFLEEGVVEMQGMAVTCPDPDWLFESLYDGVRFPRFDKPAALRAAFSTLDEDQKGVKSAARLHVDLNDPNELAGALCRVWSVSPDPEVAFRRDMLVLEMVKGESEGTAVTSTVIPTDPIAIQNDSLEIPQLTGFFPRIDDKLPPHLQRLQKLLRGVRRTFGPGSWQVNWLDDGEICWVMGCRGDGV